MDRRKFIRNATLAAIASPLYAQSCKEDVGIPIIDTHQHLWNLNRFPLTWVTPPLNRSFLMEDYLQAVDKMNVEKAIYMEVAVPPEHRKEEARWALELCESPDNPTVGAVICASPTDPDFEVYMRSLQGNPYLKGIRYFFSSKEEIISPGVVENIRLLGKMGLSFDLNLRPDWLFPGSQLVGQCPDTQFILNHCGNADPVAFFPADKEKPREPQHDPEKWYIGMERLTQHENIVCKISGIVSKVTSYPLSATDLAPIVNFCLDKFGPNRVIFAGDWPVCLRGMPLASWITLLKEIVSDHSLSDQRKLFYDNASLLYGLSA